MSKKNGLLLKDKYVYKEGNVEKRTGLLKLWKPRYFVLLDDLLCYFVKEQHKETLAPSGRIFLDDIENVDRVEKKSHVFTLLIQLKEKSHLISCMTHEEREQWFNKISEAREKHKSQEVHDPIRTKSTRLGKDYKRVTIKKDPKHGIGCTIKNVGGAIFVSRIIPDGPVATTGVLRPGDQIIDVNGNQVSECSIEKIKEIITSSPDCIICTVKPVTHYSAHNDSPQVARTPYTEVDPNALRDGASESTELLSSTPYTVVSLGGRVSSEEDFSLGGNEDGSTGDMVEAQNMEITESKSVESLDDGLAPKKNYVELEFGNR